MKVKCLAVGMLYFVSFGEARGDEFRDLFNGKDLEGWTIDGPTTRREGEATKTIWTVKDGHIATVGSGAAKGAREIDARGKTLCPGFVDTHAHDDGALLRYPGMKKHAEWQCPYDHRENCVGRAGPVLCAHQVRRSRHKTSGYRMRRATRVFRSLIWVGSHQVFN